MNEAKLEHDIKRNKIETNFLKAIVIIRMEHHYHQEHQKRLRHLVVDLA